MHIDCGAKVYLSADKIRRPKYLLGIRDLFTLHYGYYSIDIFINEFIVFAQMQTKTQM